MNKPNGVTALAWRSAHNWVKRHAVTFSGVNQAIENAVAEGEFSTYFTESDLSENETLEDLMQVLVYFGFECDIDDTDGETRLLTIGWSKSTAVEAIKSLPKDVLYGDHPCNCGYGWI